MWAEMWRIKRSATRRKGYFLWVRLTLALCASSSGKAKDLAQFFGATPGAFALYDQQTRHYVRYNEARCRELRRAIYHAETIPHAAFKKKSEE